MYDAEKDAYIVKEVYLYEISVVSIGCNGETEYLGLKSIEDAEKAYEKLNAEISEVCSGLSASKQQKIQRIISKVISLSSFKPENRKESSLEGQKADMHGNKVKSMFKNLKLK